MSMTTGPASAWVRGLLRENLRVRGARATRQRVLTAALLVAVVTPVVALPWWQLPALLFGAFCLAGTLEWVRLCGLGARGQWVYVLGALLLLALSGWILQAGYFGWVALPAAVGWLVLAPWWTWQRRGGLWARLLLGWAVVLPGWGSLLYLHAQDRLLLAYLLVLVALMDSAAYFAGRRWGQRRLAPVLSPGKTWEGLMAALLVAILFSAGWWLAGWAEPWLMLAGLVAGGAGVTGDLLESVMKRIAGVKHSGGLLAGHGGVLDRIDSLCAAAPVYAAGVLLYEFVI